ncbi:hypothetical protein LCGC14_2014950 [marine sediment metagenome]|uniref:Uncharacterized protein n=1 Tax=marine sediment metagenome TaxID=412755 RepID=A0A0F9HWG0_9ZZZZ
MENKTEVGASKASEASDFQSIFCPGVMIRKIRTDSDLVECSLSELISQYIDVLGETPNVLIVNSNDLWMAKKIVPIIGYELRIISVPLFKPDSWAIAGSKGVFWSPGA